MQIDCHVHTIFSKHWFWGRDALNTPKEMVKSAIKKGLGGIAITDHSTVKGGLNGMKIAKRYGFLVIPGIEIRSKAGDIIGLNIKQNIPDNLSLEETIEKIHDLGGIAIAPHPFAKYIFRNCLAENSIKTDAIEVFNSGHSEFYNKKALEFAERFNKPVTAGSDAHSFRDVGRAGIICESDNKDDIIEEILKKKVKIFGNRIPYKNLAILTLEKFSRALNSRISKFF